MSIAILEIPRWSVVSVVLYEISYFAEYLDSGNMFCQDCSEACNGCSGPTISECVLCADAYFKKFDAAGERFGAEYNISITELPYLINISFVYGGGGDGGGIITRSSEYTSILIEHVGGSTLYHFHNLLTSFKQEIQKLESLSAEVHKISTAYSELVISSHVTLCGHLQVQLCEAVWAEGLPLPRWSVRRLWSSMRQLRWSRAAELYLLCWDKVYRQLSYNCIRAFLKDS